MKSKLLRLISLLILGITVLLLGMTTTVKATAQVEILSHTGYIDSLDFYNVVGEVQNVGDQAVKYVRITATFYDSSDAVVDTSFTYSSLDVILAGRKSPFSITLLDTIQSAKVDHYSLSVSSFSTTVTIEEGLEILSHNSYTGALGWMHIVGEIENVATGGATYVKKL